MNQLGLVADALGMSVEFIQRRVTVTEPVHRSARIESKREQRRVNGRLELSRIAISELLADIDVDAPFSFPTIEEPGPPSPEQAAQAVRRVWRIPDGPITDLATYIEAAGSVVMNVNFGTNRIIAAYTQLAGNERWFFLNTRNTDNTRIRFSLAHELGHAVLHWDRFNAPVGAEAEREAHQFAAALLMPAEALTQELGVSKLSVEELAQVGERWGVSVQALLMRAEFLELISRHQKSRYFQRLNARGGLRTALVGSQPEEPEFLKMALDLHRTENKYSEAELARLTGLSIDWLLDLLPDYFQPPSSKPRLKLVPNEIRRVG